MPKKKKEEIKPEDQLQKILEEIRGRFGEGSIMRLDETRASDVAAIPTGSLAIDLALGVGGIPRGRVIEIFGAESTGKTTLALHIISEAQKQGGNAAFIDAEHALDPDYAEKIGVNIKELIIAQPGSGEEALQIVEKLVRSREIDVIVIDSVAALTPRAEIEGEVGDLQIGLQARLMSQAMRKLSGAISKTNSTAIFINQIREKVGVMFGNPETTPGGRALKFYSTVRLEIRRSEQIKNATDIVGNKANIKVVKNKVAPPFKRTSVDIIYGEGISRTGELVDLATDLDLIQKAGSWFAYEGEKIGQGRENAKQFLLDHPEIFDKIYQQVLTHHNISYEKNE